MGIPVHNVKQDEYHHINICLKCYELDGHNTSQCNKKENYKVCSECIVIGHTFKDCKAATKKCIDCSFDHGTMSMKCPLKKKIINIKKQKTWHAVKQ